MNSSERRVEGSGLWRCILFESVASHHDVALEFLKSLVAFGLGNIDYAW